MLTSVFERCFVCNSFGFVLPKGSARGLHFLEPSMTPKEDLLLRRPTSAFSFSSHTWPNAIKKRHPLGRLFFMRWMMGLVTVWCRFHQAGIKQCSTGALHRVFQVPSQIKKKGYQMVSFLFYGVDDGT